MGNGSIPLFGWGVLCALWLVISIVLLAVLLRRLGWTAETRSYIPTLGIVGIVIVFLLPRLEESVNGQVLGLPIRGYGVLLLLAIVAAVALAAHRAKRVGIAPDDILSFSFWLVVSGIVGARLFYIVQYWDQFQGATIWASLGATLKVTEGGLVVYGSLLGGLFTAIVLLRRYEWSILALADVVAPTLALGIAVGRIGCLLNGCCYGGVCDAPWALQFPPKSPPHYAQLRQGLLHGFRISPQLDSPVIAEVIPNSPASVAGLSGGERIVAIDGEQIRKLSEARKALEGSNGTLEITVDNGQIATLTLADWPTKSLKIHPTQLYSAINGLLICLFLLAVDPFRWRDGVVGALFLTLYPITRFLLEIIRIDESAFAGTTYTISQNASLLLLLPATVLWAYLLLNTGKTHFWRVPAGLSSSH